MITFARLTLQLDGTTTTERSMHVSPLQVCAIEQQTNGSALYLQGRDRPIYVTQNPTEVEEALRRAFADAVAQTMGTAFDAAEERLDSMADDPRRLGH